MSKTKAEIEMWGEIYLRYLYKYIEGDQWRGVQAHRAADDADKEMEELLKNNHKQEL